MDNKKNIKRRHHYVPKGLSKKFCLFDNCLFLYDLDEERICQSSPKKSFVINNFHSIYKENNIADHETIENMLMHIEANGIKAISNIIANNRINNEDIAILSIFLGFQYSRTPSARNLYETILTSSLSSTLKMLWQSGKLPPMPNELKECFGNEYNAISNIKPVIKMPQITMMSLTAAYDILDFLLKMNWCLLTSDNQDFFLLSDHPVSVFDPDIDINLGKIGGLASPKVEITMPISKNHCLLISWKNVPIVKKATEKTVKNINKRTSLFGDRFFVFPLQSKKILNLLMSYSKIRPGIKPTSYSFTKGNLIKFENDLPYNPHFESLYKPIKTIFS